MTLELLVWGESGFRIADAENLIITVGTPLRHHMEADLSQLEEVLEQIAKRLKPNHNIILRSTVALKTTEFVRKRLEAATGYAAGEQFFLSYCPERIVEGNAREELSTLPQIIGVEDMQSFYKACDVFRMISPSMIRTDYASAELVKLFNNISRYVYFALSNQFAIIAESIGASVYDILELANRDYPRKIIAKPGFTAGTCLRKDFGMISELNPYSDLLLNAWKINEFMPKFLVEGMRKRTVISGSKVAILGYTFKQDTDDMRDSLVPKLYRYLKREVPTEIRIHDPFLPEKVTDDFNDVQFINISLKDALDGADLVFVAVNHRTFQDHFSKLYEMMKKDAWIADLWNVSGTGKIFFQKKMLKGAGAN